MVVLLQLKDGSHYPSMLSSNLSMIAKAERKLLLIPLLFIVLRIWDIIDDMFVYNGVNDVQKKYIWLKVLTVSRYLQLDCFILWLGIVLKNMHVCVRLLPYCFSNYFIRGFSIWIFSYMYIIIWLYLFCN